ncbi:MAG: HEPN domain-containing protein [Nitrospirae bacterium]|nr:HEPN domain-containing protein [Nitrospirota bacterium]
MPRNSKILLAEEWFKKARDDYKSAKVVLEEGGYYGTTCFLAQQIAEKYLKGFLVCSGWKLAKIHDLVKLLNECKKISPAFADLEDECILLNDYYIETRYPLDMPVDYPKKEARQALNAADRIGKFVLKQLGR